MPSREGPSDRYELGGFRLAVVLAALFVTVALVGATVQRYLNPVGSTSASVDWSAYTTDSQSERDAAFLRENINLLAAKVGELQAKLVSIDSVGQRLAKVAGVAYTEPGLLESQSAPTEASQVMDNLFTDRQPAPAQESAEVLGRQIDALQASLTQQSGNLRLLDVVLTRRSADEARLPSTSPITDFPYLSSSYGWRRNPVTHRYAMHEGLDFSAPTGTPIVAAAGGVVLKSNYQSGYGNTVEIDHGDGLVTRYAHASSLLVKTGELVERGQKIALVGSTGKSTGPHLHFEVRMDGQPLDPRLFLQSGPPVAPVATKDAGTSLTAHNAASNVSLIAPSLNREMQ